MELWHQSYTIITTEANELMAPPHDRMPDILHRRHFDRWLDREKTVQLPIDLLRPFPADEMESFKVSRDVGNVKNNSTEMPDGVCVRSQGCCRKDGPSQKASHWTHGPCSPHRNLFIQVHHFHQLVAG
jgi:hypothetical protein